MRKRHILTSLFVFTLCLSCSQDEKLGTSPVHLYLEPTEEHLWSASQFPDFVNYPDDRAKMGVKGKVRKIVYETAQPLLWIFSSDGKLLNVTYIFGSYIREMHDWRFYYNEAGNLTQTAFEQKTLYKGRESKGFKGSPIDEISLSEDGKMDTRSMLAFNRVSVQKQFQYNGKGICTSVAYIENGKSGSDKLTYNERGQVTRIQLKQTRIPTHGLTRGDRDIVPAYDDQGRIASLRCMSIPQNMEAYNIDSIDSQSSYEYNENNDVVLWHYTDTVYPRKYPNEFSVRFEYVYDEQNNWTEKRMISYPGVLSTLMNSYYRGEYPMNYLEPDEEGNQLAEIVIKRTITYYEPTDESKASEHVSPYAAKDGKAASSQSQSSLNNGEVKFHVTNLAYWDVQKVVCNGPKNGGYEFVISGVLLKDCPKSLMSSNAVTVAVKEKSKTKLTSPGSYFFPGGKKGESFSVTIVAAFDGMCNINDFEFLAILPG